MDYSLSMMTKGPGDGSLGIPVQLSHLGSGEEHVAGLADLRKFGLLRRWADLLDEGVAGLFGIMGEEAELVGVCFHAEKFTPAVAGKWLAERGFRPRAFIASTSEEQGGVICAATSVED